MRYHKTANFPRQNPVQETPQAFLVVVHPGAEISDNLELPAVCGAKRFQHHLLAFQVIPLIVARHPRVRDGDPRQSTLVWNAGEQTRNVVAPLAAAGPLIRDQTTALLPPAESEDRNTECRSGFAYGNKSVHSANI